MLSIRWLTLHDQYLKVVHDSLAKQNNVIVIVIVDQSDVPRSDEPMLIFFGKDEWERKHL